MADLLDQAFQWLEEQRHLHRTRSVTYKRGGESLTLLATIGRTEFEVIDAAGATERVESRDFLVRAIDLVLTGVQSLPRPGDLIEESQDGTTYVYEVLRPGGAPAWRYSDPHRRTLRIHTKQISSQ